MRYLLFAFSFFLVTSVLCQSCKEEVTSARSMLVAADSMMWSNPDSALLVLEQIPDSRELRGEERAFVCVAADASPIQELCAAGERFADTDSGRLLRRRRKAGTAGASIFLLGMCLYGK